MSYPFGEAADAGAPEGLWPSGEWDVVRRRRMMLRWGGMEVSP